MQFIKNENGAGFSNTDLDALLDYRKKAQQEKRITELETTVKLLSERLSALENI